MPDSIEAASGKRRAAGKTRAMLVDACLELVRQEGVGALTVPRLAQAAGISTQGFYKHFRNADALLAVALGGRMEEIASQQSLVRLDISFRRLDDLPTRAFFRDTLDEMLGRLAAEPRLATLYLRYHNDTTMLDGAIARVAQRMRDETVAFYWDHAQRMGASQSAYAVVAVFAEHIVAVYYRAAEMVINGQYERADVVEMTADSVLALVREMITRSIERLKE